MTSAAIELREATAEDEQAIVAIAEEVVCEGHVFVFEDVADVMDYWRRGRAFVALQGGELVGTYSIKPNQKGRGSHVANVGYMVRQTAQGLGVGSAMGAHSIQQAAQLGYTAIQFNMVVTTNTGAIHVWKKLGFEIVGNLPGVFRHPDRGLVDAYVMFRKL